jgi:hypothetical protein
MTGLVNTMLDAIGLEVIRTAKIAEAARLINVLFGILRPGRGFLNLLSLILNGRTEHGRIKLVGSVVEVFLRDSACVVGDEGETNIILAGVN